MKHGIMCGVFLVSMALPAFAQEPNIFSWKVGRFEVYTLVENRRAGGVPTILIGAGQEMLDRYYPNSTSMSQTNAFLIKGGGKIILVDTGFGTTLFDNLRTLGISPDRVNVVLITHLHGDHIGGLQKDGRPMFPNATIYLSQQELDYFTKTNVNQNVVAALAPYGRKVVTFNPGELGARNRELLRGITPIAAFGHTPGHTVFMVESAGEKLLIWGDLMHAEPIQFPLPNIAVSYDSDALAAVISRTRILEYVTANNIPIAGMHLLYPSIGTVSRDGAGYKLTPAR